MMVPGEIVTAEGEVELGAGRERRVIEVLNTGDRPIQVGSHFHFADVNAALAFDREAAVGLPARRPGRDVGALRAGRLVRRDAGRAGRRAARARAAGASR